MLTMRQAKTLALILASAIPLAACGGGDSGGGGVASTPAPTYKTLDQLSGNQTFQTAGINLTNTTGTGGNYGTSNFGSGVTVAYTAASDSYLLTAPNGTTATFAPGNVTGSVAGSYVSYSVPYAGGTDMLILSHPAIGGVALSYTLLGNWGHVVNSPSSVTINLAVGGIPTQNADVPRTGTATYTTLITGGGALGPINLVGGTTVSTTSSATFSANFGSNSVTTSLNLVNANTLASIGTFNGNGTISSSGPGFAGTLSGNFPGAVAATGEFSGVFTGPQAAEMGFAWRLNNAGTFMDGFVVGKKN